MLVCKRKLDHAAKVEVKGARCESLDAFAIHGAADVWAKNDLN
jgi:hypothetical protein